MRRLSFLLLASTVLFALPHAMHSQTLPVPGYSTGTPIPNAHETPDPKLTYKVFFEVGKAAPAAGDVNPQLAGVASFVNTLAQFGVDAKHRSIAVIIDGDAAYMIQNDAAYAVQNGGVKNPNTALIQALTKAGVELHVCGQAASRRKIAPENIQPEISLDYSAWTSIANFQLRGYVRVGDN